jgi:heat-inducible transcriptional repressor
MGSREQRVNELSLNERSREILHWAISSFVSTGKPVGSRRIARKSREHLSAATVRNIMADLEEMGYLRQPHASAGRVPTDKAYRFYVDYMLERHAIFPRDRKIIDSGLLSDDTPEQLMGRTSQLLSKVSSNLGIVVSPPVSQVALQHIQFVKLADRRVLVVVVSPSGIVQNRSIQMEEEYSQSELDEAARYILVYFKGKSLLEIRAELLKMLHQERAQYDRLVQRVIGLGVRSFAEEKGDLQPGIYVDGAANFLMKPEFSDLNRMRKLFETIEERGRLAALVTECIRNDSQEVRITIGAENLLPGIEDCTLITSPYVVDDKIQGSLGILGPKRMEYARAISVVEYVARLFGRVLSTRGT